MIVYCIKDPHGNLNHTTAALDAREAIRLHLEMEIPVFAIANCGRRMRGQSQLCRPSWEHCEAEGYAVVRCELSECHSRAAAASKE